MCKGHRYDLTVKEAPRSRREVIQRTLQTTPLAFLKLSQLRVIHAQEAESTKPGDLVEPSESLRR